MVTAATALIVTCEHGGNDVPPAYAGIFAGHEALLASHRGWDAGALLLAREMAAALDAPLFASTTTRLVVDLNRSIGHRQLHSEITRPLAPVQRAEIIAQHYRPHRHAVESAVAACVASGKNVLHIASHSFTPILDGEVRRADVALLYDPARSGETRFAAQWKAALAVHLPGLALRRNDPYEGKGDGLTSLLRTRFTDAQYVGIELEVNQRFVEAGGPQWEAVRKGVVAALRDVLGAVPHAVGARLAGR